MNLIKIILWKYPDASIDSHVDESGNLIIDNWSSASHPNVLTNSEITDIQTEYYNSIDYNLEKFSPDLFVERLNVVFSGNDAIPLMPYYAVIKDYIILRNFADLKTRLTQLLNANIITQSNIDSLSSVLLEQNINLGDF